MDHRNAQSVLPVDTESAGADGGGGDLPQSSLLDPLACIIGMQEYDISYTMRVAIDLDIRVGAWFLVTPIPTSEVCMVSDMLSNRLSSSLVG